MLRCDLESVLSDAVTIGLQNVRSNVSPRGPANHLIKVLKIHEIGSMAMDESAS